MPDHLTAAQSRLSNVAETVLLDHLGMMAPVVVEEVLALVAAAKPLDEQQMLTAFFGHLRMALPSELDSKEMINSLYARYLQS